MNELVPAAQSGCTKTRDSCVHHKVTSNNLFVALEDTITHLVIGNMLRYHMQPELYRHNKFLNNA